MQNRLNHLILEPDTPLLTAVCTLLLVNLHRVQSTEILEVGLPVKSTQNREQSTEILELGLPAQFKVNNTEYKVQRSKNLDNQYSKD